MDFLSTAGLLGSFTVRNVLLGATLLGAVGGMLGCFALLRRQSLLGDALAHAALPGVCLAYLFTGTKESLPLLLGAAAAGLVGALVILTITRMSGLSEDSAIGIVLSVFFGAGIVLLTYIQKLPFGNQSGLDKFLFGQAATLVPRDVINIAVVAILVTLTVVFFFRQFKVVSFDREFAQALGLPVLRLEILLTLLLVMVVVIGLQTVGVVLIIATLITPAAAARQWTDRLVWMLVLAGVIGAVSGSTGALVSASFERLPTGPVIVLVATVFLQISLLLAPRRGQLWEWLRARRMSLRIRQENLLKDLYLWAERNEEEISKPVPWPFLRGGRAQSGGQVLSVARRLERSGMLERLPDGARLTGEGLDRALDVVRKHRLWEMYLSRRLQLPADHLHRDAEVMEHALDDDTVARIDDLLGSPTLDPHGRPIPPPAGRRRAPATAEARP